MWDFDEFWEVNEQYPHFDGLCRVSFNQTWTFADDATRNDYETAKSMFVAANNKDTHYDLDSPLESPECSDHFVFDEGTYHYFLKFPYYLLASMFLMSAPYRIWFQGLISEKTINMNRVIRKRVYSMESISLN